MAEFTIEHLDPESLVPHPANFRRHPDPQKDALEQSLDEHGWLSAPIWNKRTARLVDGHARVELARGKEARIPVRVIDVPEEQERRILRAFDRIGAMALEDTAALEALIAEIGDPGLEELLAGIEVPEFAPVGEDEQGRLDERATVTCPDCGFEFTPP